MKELSLDREMLHQFYDGCNESMTEVFTEFENKYEELKNGLASPELSSPSNELKKFLHFHGPSFMYIGLPEISKRFKALEIACMDLNLSSEEFSASHNLLVKDVTESYALVTQELNNLKQSAA